MYRLLAVLFSHYIQNYYKKYRFETTQNILQYAMINAIFNHVILAALQRFHDGNVHV